MANAAARSEETGSARVGGGDRREAVGEEAHDEPQTDGDAGIKSGRGPQG